MFVAVFGMRRVGGVGCVFVRLLLVGAFVMPMLFVPMLLMMRVFFVRFRARRCYRDRCLERHRHRHVGRGFYGWRFVRVSMVVVAKGMFKGMFMSMFVLVVMLVRMLMMIMLMMIMIMMLVIMLGSCMVMTGVVDVALVGMQAVRMFIGLSGLRRVDTGVLDDFALDALAIAAATRIAVARAAAVVGAVFAFFFGLAMGALVRLDQGLTIGDWNLIIIRMDFAEGEKAVTVAAILDEGSLQGWFYTRDFGEVDIATQLFALSGLEIKLFDSIAADHDDPGLFRVGGIDEHFVGHFGTLDGGGRV